MEEKVCKGCGKKNLSTDMKIVQMKTCCSVQKIPVCLSCWQKFYGKKHKD